jgi:hypothetical protein
VAQLSTLSHYRMLYYCIFLLTVFILPTLFVVAAAAYVTSLVCRFARWRHWRLRWHFCLIGAFAGGVCGIGLFWLGTSLQPGIWGKGDLRPYFLFLCAVGSGLGTIPAGLVVQHYRKNIKDVDHVA